MVYESMKKRMEPLKIYRSDARLIDIELRVYAAEIERLYSALDSMFTERFISTAQGDGLTVYEEMFGPDRTGEDIVRRREMLNLRMNLGEGDFTPKGIKKALDSLGLSYVISEFPEIDKLNITAVTEDYSVAEQAFIEREIAKIMPAHLDYQITFNTLTWGQIDAMERSFAAADAEDLTWKQIDTRTE